MVNGLQNCPPVYCARYGVMTGIGAGILAF